MAPSASDFGLPWISNTIRGGAGAAAAQPFELDDLTLDLNGDLGIIQAGQGVSNWADQSGTGNDAAQPTNNERPGYTAADAKFNSHGSVNFDGVNETMTIPDSATLEIASAGFTLYVVCSGVAGTGSRRVMSKEVAGDSGWAILLQSSGAAGIIMRNGADTADYIAIAQTFNGTTGHIVRIRWDSDVAGVRVDNNAEVTDATETGFRESAVAVGLGGRPNSTLEGQVDIARVLLYQRFLSAAEDTNLMSYLQSTYGV